MKVFLNEGFSKCIFAHTAAEGKTYRTSFYNLDAVISAGYRVNSRRKARQSISDLGDQKFSI
ncbi:MAG: virulence RhuM family protein [Deltaproteobacteria bacterium]|nr:virulence RhuM family protein [Deltaproteobacteria bacterium]